MTDNRPQLPDHQQSVAFAEGIDHHLDRNNSLNRQRSVQRSVRRKSSSGSLPVPTNESLKGMRRDSLPMPSATAEIVGDTDLIPPDYAFDLEKGQSENHEEVNESEGTSDKEEKDPFLIDSFEHDASADPKTWNSYYRWFLTVIAGILVLNSTFSSSSPSGISLNLMQEFTFSREVATLAISLFVGGYCIGPLLWGPLSEGPLGRKGVLLISFFCYWMFTLGCALSPNTASILIFRLLSGCFGAAPLVVSGAVIADLWDPKRRGVAMSVFGLAPFAGPAISPVISGFISASGTDWRILFWVLFAFAGACFVIILLVLPETYAPVLHQRIARRLRKETGDNRYRAPIDERKRDIRSELNNTILKPFIMLFLEPMLSSLTLFMSLIYGVLYLLFEAYPIVFGPGGHNFNEGIQGLMFLPLFIGGFCACLGNLFFFNPRYIKAMEKHAPKLPPPEIRLEQACVGGVAFAAAFFWFGWTSYPWISFWSPCIAGGVIGASILFVFLALFNYIIDAYLWSASTALAANTIVRSAFGAGFPLFASQMFETLNPRWASTLLGCIAALLSLIPFVLIKYGPTLRAKSKFAPDI